MAFRPVTDIGNFPVIGGSDGGGGGGGGGDVTIGTTVIPVGGSTLTLEGLTSVTSALFVGNLLGTSTSTSSLVLSNSTLDQNNYITFSATASGQSSILTNNSLRFNPSTGVLTSTIFSGSGALLTNIPNSALASSSITIGSTTISLGGTTLTLAGLTSVTSTTFVGNLTGTSTQADKIKVALWSVNQFYKVPFVDSATAYVGLLHGNLLYSPQADTLQAGFFSGSGGLLTDIPNSALINSSITIGATNIPLGSTVGSLSGLTSVTATTFVGSLTGNADSASSVNLTTTTANFNHYVTFAINPLGNNALRTNNLLFNPSTDTLTSTNFAGNLTGTASNVTVVNSASNTAYSVLFSSINTGSAQLFTDTTGFTYNPSTNTLAAVTFSGNLTGTATNATNVNVVSTTTNATFFVNFTSASSGNTPVRARTGFTFNPSTNVFSVPSITATAGYTITNTTANINYPILFVDNVTGFSLLRAGGTATYNPTTNVLTAGTFSGSGALLVNIPNSALTNSSITIGTTLISLGQTTTTLAGLTSVTSTTFVGNLTGTATTASQVSLTSNVTNSSFLVTFATGIGNQPLYVDSLIYNPSTSTLSAGTFSGSGAGLTGIPNGALINSLITIGTTSISLGDTTLTLAGLTSITATTFIGSLNGNAGSASQINLTDTALNVIYGLVFTDASVGGNSTLFRSTTNNITFNPSTGFLTAVRFVGSGAGLTNIPNSALTNSSVTIGTTNISLGATSLILAGLTSVTSTTFVGSLTGNASSASQVGLVSTVLNLGYNVLFSSGATGNSTVFTSGNNNIIFNPSTGVLTVTQFSGSGAGLTNIPNAALTNSSITIGTTNVSLGATTLTLAGLTSVTAGTFNGSGAGLTNIPNAALTNSSITIGTTNISLGATTLTLAGLTSVSAGTFNGSGAGLTNIPNAALTNSTITLGTSTVSLGGTLTNIAGLGTVTATTFSGNLTGTATNADNLAVNLSTTDASFYLTFVPNAIGSTQAVFINSTISVNPSTGFLTAARFVGSGAGLTNIPNSALTNSSITIGTTNISLGATALSLVGLTSVSAGTFTGSGAGLTNIPNGALTNSSITIGTTNVSLGATTLTLVGLTSVTAGSFSGSGAGLTNIPNAALTNSTITLGTSTVALGGTLTNISGLGTVTATTFVGSFSGTVTNAQNLLTTVSTTNASFYLTFVPNAATSTQAFFVNSAVSVNPSTGALTATSFSGSGVGLNSIPNAALTNSSITIGTTTISLGATSLTLAGLTSVQVSTITSTADLTLNPTGPNVDFSGKNILNSNAIVTNDGIRFGPGGLVGSDIRLYKLGTNVLSLDNNAGGSASIVITGGVTANIATISTSISCQNVFSSTNILDLANSRLTFTPGLAQTILRARTTSDTQFRTLLSLDNGLQFGPGGTTAPDVRFYRTGGTAATLDDGAGGAATLASIAGTLSGWATITRNGNLSIETSGSNGNITYTTNGSGDHIFNSTTGNVQINRPITTLSGNLVLNPAGTSIDFSNKALINVGSVAATSLTINTPITSADILYSSTLVSTTGAGVSVFTPNDSSSYQYNPQLLRNYIGPSTFPQNNYTQNTTSNRVSFTNLPNLIRTKQPTTGMQFVACSASGRVVAVANSTQILVSQDYGSTFGTPISISGITSIAICNSGQYIITNNTDNTNISIQISTNYGQSFNQVVVAAVASTPVTWVSISGNCRYILVNTATATQYLSTNYGTSFVTRSVTGNSVTGSSISADGRYMVISPGNVLGSGGIIVSQDYGATFVSPANNASLIGETQPAMSDDFKYIFIPGNGAIQFYNNYAVGAASTLSYGGTGSSARLRCSSDGRIVIVSVGPALNQLRYSQDFGQTFANFSFTGATGLAITDNGQFFYLIDSGNLYQYGNAVTLSNYGSADIAGVLTVGSDAVIGGASIFNGTSLFNGDVSMSVGLTVQKILSVNTIGTFNSTALSVLAPITNTISNIATFGTDSANGTIAYSGISDYKSLLVSNSLTPTANGTATITIQSLFSPAGYMAINFNGIFNGAETRFNTAKTRWRINANQNGANDIFGIDNLNATGVIAYMNATRPTNDRILVDYPNAYNTNFYAAPRAYLDIMSASINQNTIGNADTFASSGITVGTFTIPTNLFLESNGRGFELIFSISSNFPAGTNVSMQLFIDSVAGGVITIYGFGQANSIVTFNTRFTVNNITGTTATFRFFTRAVSTTASRTQAAIGTYSPTTTLNAVRTVGLRLLNNTVVAATTIVTLNSVTLTIF